MPKYILFLTCILVLTSGRLNFPQKVNKDNSDKTWNEGRNFEVNSKRLSSRILKASNGTIALAEEKESIDDGFLSKLIQNVIDSFPQLKKNLEKRTSEVIDRLVNRGFTFFSEEMSFEEYRDLEDQYFDPFAESLEDSLELPQEHRDQIKFGMQDVLFSDSSSWIGYNVAFSTGKGSDCRYVCVLARHDKELKKSNWLVADIKASFQLAPNLLVIQEKRSFLGGLWSESTSRIVELPAAITLDQLYVVFEFFEIVTFQRFAEIIRKKTSKTAAITLESEVSSFIINNATKRLLQGETEALELLKQAVATLNADSTKALQEIAANKNDKVQLLARKGLPFFIESTRVRKTMGIMKEFFPKFVKIILDGLKIPATKRKPLESILKNIDEANGKKWKAYQVVYSSDEDIQDSCRVFSLLTRYNPVSKKVDVVLAEIGASFELANQVLIITKMESLEGSPFSGLQIKFIESSNFLSYGDIDSILEFCKIVSLKSLAEILKMEHEA